MSEGALDESGVHASFEQMGGVRMPEGRDGYACFDDPSTVFGGAEGALDTGPTHGGGRGRTVVVIPPGGGKEPGGVTMGFPGGAEQSQRIGGQGDIPVFGALAMVDMDLEALPVNSGDLQGKGFMEPEAQARDGGEGDLVVQGSGRLEDSPDLLHTEDSGETVRGLCPQERERGPIALEDVLIEEANTAVADAHGGWGEAVDVFPVQEVVLKLLFGDAVGGFVVELRQQPDFTDIAFLSPFAFATEMEGCNHLLT